MMMSLDENLITRKDEIKEEIKNAQERLEGTNDDEEVKKDVLNMFEAESQQNKIN